MELCRSEGRGRERGWGVKAKKTGKGQTPKAFAGWAEKHVSATQRPSKTWGANPYQGETLAGVNTMHAQEAGRGLAGVQLIRLIIWAFLRLWVAHACNPSLWEAEAVGSEVQGYLWLHSKSETSLGYIVNYREKPWLHETLPPKEEREGKKAYGLQG